jgi:hypothetical protein
VHKVATVLLSHKADDKMHCAPPCHWMSPAFFVQEDVLQARVGLKFHDPKQSDLLWKDAFVSQRNNSIHGWVQWQNTTISPKSICWFVGEFLRFKLGCRFVDYLMRLLNAKQVWCWCWKMMSVISVFKQTPNHFVDPNHFRRPTHYRFNKSPCSIFWNLFRNMFWKCPKVFRNVSESISNIRKILWIVFRKYFWTSSRILLLKWILNSQKTCFKSKSERFWKNFKENFNEIDQFFRTFGRSCPSWQRKIFIEIFDERQNRLEMFRNFSPAFLELLPIFVQIGNEINSETFWKRFRNSTFLFQKAAETLQKCFVNYKRLQKRFWNCKDLCYTCIEKQPPLKVKKRNSNAFRHLFVSTLLRKILKCALWTIDCKFDTPLSE